MNQQNGMQQILSKVTSKYRNQLRLALFISLFIFLIGILFSIISKQNIILISGAILSSLLFFIHAFQAPDIDGIGKSNSVIDSYLRIVFFLKLNYLALSISSMGIMFALLKPAETNVMSLVGGFTILVSLLFQIFIIQKPNGYLIKRELLLINIVFAIIVFLLMFY